MWMSESASARAALLAGNLKRVHRRDSTPALIVGSEARYRISPLIDFDRCLPGRMCRTDRFPCETVLRL
jgi:hypothetical protein